MKVITATPVSGDHGSGDEEGERILEMFRDRREQGLMLRKRKMEDSQVPLEFLVCITGWIVVFLAGKWHREEAFLSLSFINGF